MMPAAADQRDLLAQLLGLLEVVRGEQDRRAGPRAGGGCSATAPGAARSRRPRSARRGSRAAARASARGRAAGGGACRPRASARATPAFARRSNTSIISPRAAPRVRAVHPVVAAVEAQRLLDVEEAVEVDVLLGEADQPARLERVVRVAEDARLALRDPDQVADGGDQRRLARAVGAEQAEELAVADRAGRRRRARGSRRRSAWSGRGARGRRATSPLVRIAGIRSRAVYVRLKTRLGGCRHVTRVA